ncbi:dUTP diphosphatase [Natranaerobius trueperi]|uniref:dUTP diphosphatase n=1 Tax=Natranaerobius trueperi TaxID=759412 RepID=A0A226C115_9FIRM|nr:dUTP diphosphatase [Natranaerobius trueperi]OWZ84294.1 dUTPase [Natranaerobius trueperi]
MRKFEPVSKKFMKHNAKEAQMPTRADARSAGYDFYSPIETIIKPNSSIIIWSNIKAAMEDDEVLKIYVRSSMGIKKKIMLANTVGIIDSSYYGNPSNDGNIGIALYNYGDTPVTIQEGERIAQGIFHKYLTVENDHVINKERTGGIGSTEK